MRSFVFSFDFRLTQDRQCTYNVILRRVRATIVALDSNKYCIFWMCICRLRYPICKAHAPNFHLWPARLCDILPNCLIKATIFKKKVIERKMCVLIFSTTFVWTIYHSKRKWTRYEQKWVGLLVEYQLSCSILMILEFFSTDVRKTLKSNFTKIRPVGGELFHANRRTDGRTDGRDEANSS
jgi:hypothetical protein